jgi:hypothetical protein
MFYTKTIYSQTSVPRTRMGRIPWMAQTELKVLSIFLILLSIKKNLSLQHRYLEQSNSINGHYHAKLEHRNLTDICMLRLNVLTARC